MRPSRIFERDPEVMGGELVFAGTRVPVRAMVDYPKASHTLEAFLEDFPSVGHDHAEEYLEWSVGAARAEVESA